jgi:hypothetical protein
MLALPAGNVIFLYGEGMMQWIYSGWVAASWVLKTLGNP